MSDFDQGDVLFIHDIRRRARVVEEILYPTMDDFELNIVVGKGPGTRSIKARGQVVYAGWANTRSGLLSSPLHNRFGQHYHLDF